MSNPRNRNEREELERTLAEPDEATRQSRGTTPDEDTLERALEIEPGVEQHAGEDPGGVTEPP